LDLRREQVKGEGEDRRGEKSREARGEGEEKTPTTAEILDRSFSSSKILTSFHLLVALLEKRGKRRGRKKLQQQLRC